MKKGTPEQIALKREEIINACEQLYQTMNFREITLKEIGSITSFSHPTIYNYFQTKEEIFLALFRREYDRWNEDLAAILDGDPPLARGGSFMKYTKLGNSDITVSRICMG